MSTTTTSLSQLLGYTSIACWLGAQFPQVVENYQRQSCEGLALPFLANWLLGDISNLVGCLLTHQLPFQTYLATYFVIVDLTLVAQYFYYSNNAKTVVPHPHHPRPQPSVSRTRRTSIDRGAARYRTLSAVAANVAATAALAAQQEDHPDHHRRRWPGHSSSRAPVDSDDDVDDNALAALADSFHSESGHDGRKRVSWSIERHRTRSGSLGGTLSASQQQLPIHQSTSDLLSGRGRPLERELLDDGLEIEQEAASPGRRHPNRRTTGSMMFLGAWALFGIGTFANSRRSASTGTVFIPRNYDGQTPPLYEALITDPISERVIGRIFAWLCTTLYLTSRLPQIWKNFVRKSVEGLSMYLFVFAFLGNVFYVASILTSPNMRKPPPESISFLTESIPYLLGSGGTLMFDVTIVAQSFIYRPKSRRHSTLYSSRVEEEETGLLGGSEGVARGRASRSWTS